MKKLFLAISTIFLVLFGAMTISASAARYTELPITMNQSYNGFESMFTMTDFDIEVYSNDSPKYTNNVYGWVEGQFNKGSNMTLVFYCYDASGNHISTHTQDISYDSEYEDYSYYSFDFNVPDVTASVEIGTAYPGSWSNTYHYCKYMNVYADDGRALGIHDLLLPVYEKCGWHGPVWMYALDGREILVPYCDIAAYQKVGWYLWPDYCYSSFVKDYNEYTKNGDYDSAFYEVEWAISQLNGTYYESSVYSYKTKLMDAWRKKINGPLAVTDDYVFYDEEEYDTGVRIYFRNVSYKTIKAFRVQFECYDVFGNYEEDYIDYYYEDNTWLASGEEESYYWSGLPYGTDHIKNIRVTQVVYSDNTYWYK